MKWWYLSFSDEEAWLGACVVGPVETSENAVLKARRVGFDFSGPVEIVVHELGGEGLARTPKAFLNRRLNMDDLKAMDAAISGGDGEAVEWVSNEA